MRLLGRVIKQTQESLSKVQSILNTTNELTQATETTLPKVNGELHLAEYKVTTLGQALTAALNSAENELKASIMISTKGLWTEHAQQAYDDAVNSGKSPVFRSAPDVTPRERRESLGEVDIQKVFYGSGRSVMRGSDEFWEPTNEDPYGPNRE